MAPVTMAPVTVVNLSREPQTLEDGTMIGAAGTPESKREGVTLSEGDRRRLVERDVPILAVIEQKSVEPPRVDEPRAPEDTKPERRPK